MWPAAAAQEQKVNNPGPYRIIHDGTIVTSDVSTESRDVAQLKAGTLVDVLEVSAVSHGRVRGRIASPVGWVSLMQTETGYRWAMAYQKSSWPIAPIPMDGDVCSWLEDALSAERAAVAFQLEQTHRALVAGLFERLRSSEGGPGVAPTAPQLVKPQAPELQLAPLPPTAIDEPEAIDDPEVEAEKERIKHLEDPHHEIHFGEQDDQVNNKANYSLEAMVKSPIFEVVFTGLIILNALVTAAEVQYAGYDVGYLIGYKFCTSPAVVVWPHAEGVFDVIGFGFGCLFTLEVLIKMIVYKSHFPCCLWNLFDTLIIGAWLVVLLGSYFDMAVELPIDPMILRLCRLARITRLIRVFKFVKAVDILHMLMKALRGCLPVLCWATLMLVGIFMIGALILNYAVQPFLDDTANALKDPDPRIRVYGFFGTFTRSMLTMFEITLGNWVPVCRLLAEEISEWYALVFLCYKMLVGFAVIKVVTGVFLCETFKVANTDDELMIMAKEKAMRMNRKKMQKLFAAADSSGDGTVGWEEFQGIIKDPQVRVWLSSMELDVRDPEALFQLLDDGDHEVCADEMTKGVGRLKGPTRALDFQTWLVRDFADLKEAVAGISKRTLAQESALGTLARVEQALNALSRGGASNPPGTLAVTEFNM